MASGRAISSSDSAKEDTFLAAEITFNHKECRGSQPDTLVWKYCQQSRNGGGDVRTVIYPWKGDQDQALVVFDESYCSPDVVQSLIARRNPPITGVVDFSESQCFHGLIQIIVSPTLLEKLLSLFTWDKIITRLTIATQAETSEDESNKRLTLRGFFFQLKLAEECLNRLEGEVDSKAESQTGTASKVKQKSEAEPPFDAPSKQVVNPPLGVKIVAEETFAPNTSLNLGESNPAVQINNQFDEIPLESLTASISDKIIPATTDSLASGDPKLLTISSKLSPIEATPLISTSPALHTATSGNDQAPKSSSSGEIESADSEEYQTSTNSTVDTSLIPELEELGKEIDSEDSTAARLLGSPSFDLAGTSNISEPISSSLDQSATHSLSASGLLNSTSAAPNSNEPTSSLTDQAASKSTQASESFISTGTPKVPERTSPSGDQGAASSPEAAEVLDSSGTPKITKPSSPSKDSSATGSPESSELLDLKGASNHSESTSESTSPSAEQEAVSSPKPAQVFDTSESFISTGTPKVPERTSPSGDQGAASSPEAAEVLDSSGTPVITKPTSSSADLGATSYTESSESIDSTGASNHSEPTSPSAGEAPSSSKAAEVLNLSGTSNLSEPTSTTDPRATSSQEASELVLPAGALKVSVTTSLSITSAATSLPETVELSPPIGAPGLSEPTPLSDDSGEEEEEINKAKVKSGTSGSQEIAEETGAEEFNTYSLSKINRRNPIPALPNNFVSDYSEQESTCDPHLEPEQSLNPEDSEEEFVLAPEEVATTAPLTPTTTATPSTASVGLVSQSAAPTVTGASTAALGTPPTTTAAPVDTSVAVTAVSLATAVTSTQTTDTSDTVAQVTAPAAATITTPTATTSTTSAGNPTGHTSAANTIQQPTSVASVEPEVVPPVDTLSTALPNNTESSSTLTTADQTAQTTSDKGIPNAPVIHKSNDKPIEPVAEDPKISTAEALKRSVAQTETEGDQAKAKGATNHQLEQSDSEDESDNTMLGSKKSKKEVLEVEEEFDKIYYEYMRIMHKRDFKARILDSHGGQLFETNHPTDSRILLVKVKCSAPGETTRMMEAINDMFYEINRSLHSHSIKLLYDGDKAKLAQALIDDLQDESLGFIARLVTKDDIRIIGHIANMDRDIHAVESFIDKFKQKHPAQSVPKLTATDIALPNGTIVTVMEEDLTKMRCDAIVSSSGPDLSHNSGVSRAIAQACGQRFSTKGMKFVSTNGKLHEGDTYVQEADGRLKVNGVKHVIHAIAPSPQRGREPTALIIMTVSAAIIKAEALECRTVALPAICAGNMGVPIATCAECYWAALDVFSSQSPRPCLKQIYFVIDNPIFVSQIHHAMSNLAVQGIRSAHYHVLGSQPTPHDRQNLRPEQHDEFRQSDRSGRGRGAMENVAVHGGHRVTTKTNHSDAGGMFDNVAQTVSGLAPFVPTIFGGSNARQSGSSIHGEDQFGKQYDDPSSSDRNFIGARDAGRGPSFADVVGTRRGGATGSTAVGSYQGGLIGSGASNTTHAQRMGPAGSYPGTAVPSTGSHLDPAESHVGASSAAGANATPSAATGTTKPNDNECPICMDDIKNPTALACSHRFCKDCIDMMIKTSKSNLCPTCRTPFRNAEGQQPKGGRMTTTHCNKTRLPGYEGYGTIIIAYSIQSGKQGPEHPNPGQPYHGTTRTAYLPDNPKGRKAEKLLRKAFNQRLTFTIGQSVTTGQDNCVVWNDIHHKTNVHGGPSGYGYPDPQYMDRLIEDLKAKGVTE